MRWMIGLPAVVLAIGAGVASGQAIAVGNAAPTEEHREAERFTYPMRNRVEAMRALAGHRVVLRVYPNPYVNPERYVKASVPVDNDAVQLSAIKATVPEVTFRSQVLLQAADQMDEAVAKALEGCVTLTVYRDREWSIQSYHYGGRVYEPYWTFLDAQGKPMAGASVETKVVFSGFRPGSPSLILGRATLDEKGRLKRLLCDKGVFIFTVQHRNYGVASVLLSTVSGDPSGICIVPLVPKDSPTAAQSICGTVVDGTGRPVEGVAVRCCAVTPPGGSSPSSPWESWFSYETVTDADGHFLLCIPVISRDLKVEGLFPAGSRYRIELEPPRSSNLRRPTGPSPIFALAGSEATYTLTSLDATTVFHTFAFRFPDHEVTDADERRGIRLTLRREGGEGPELSYMDVKDGYTLPVGTLEAEIMRSRGPLSFPSIKLDANSPTHLIFQMPAPITVRGQVVDSTTGKPMAGVYVSPEKEHKPHDPNAWTPQRWQELQWAVDHAIQAHDPYILDGVWTTDVNGCFEFTIPANRQAEYLEFSALAPGYGKAFARVWRPFGTMRPSDDVPLLTPDANGVAKVPTIEMVPLERIYFPKFVFEDEHGPVTDPNKLRGIYLTIVGKNPACDRPLSNYLEAKEFIPGTYQADGTWGDRYYQFGPVDLRTNRSKVVVFKPALIRPRHVIYRGQVTDRATDLPIAGAIVYWTRSTADTDGSDLSQDDWAALRKLDPARNANAPAEASKKTLCDDHGRFELSAEQNSRLGRAAIIVLAPDYIGMQQTLYVLATLSRKAARWEPRFVVNNGGVTLPVIRLCPAATIRIHPVVTDVPATLKGSGIGLRSIPEPNDRPAWLENPDPRKNGQYVLYRNALRPNEDGRLYVPAQASLNLLTYHMQNLGKARLRQGEVLDLGHMEYQFGVIVHVRVIDSRGNPVPNVVVLYVDDQTDFPGSPMDQGTDAAGMMAIRVPLRTTGRIAFRIIDDRTGKRLEDSIPCRVEGREDSNREFTLRLSAEIMAAYERMMLFINNTER